MFETPILFLIFNRPDNTAQVFEAIQKVKPAKLFIAADGPRADKEGEWEICQQTRAIATKVDWDCKVETLFRSNNLGCKLAVSSGISWFFEHVEQGIILEDDCKPHPDFFQFCEQLLSRYHTDPRIMMICGTNYFSKEVAVKMEHSYFFANYYPIWGWATWKRAWSLYDVNMKSWKALKQTKQLYWIFSSPKVAAYYEYMFDLIDNGFDTWDIQWWYTCIFQSGLAVIPKYNLISNIGVTGTHTSTQGNYSIDMPTYSVMNENFVHPHFVLAEKHLNELTYKMSHAQIDVCDGSGNDTSDGIVKPNYIKSIIKRVLRRVAGK